jgi:hypothetical protein
VILAGCGGDGGGDPSDAVDLDGLWALQAEVTNPTAQAECSAGGSLFIQQNGAQFTGSLGQSIGSCTDPDGEFASGNLDGVLLFGSIHERQVTYTHRSCQMVGTAIGTPVSRIEGTIACTSLRYRDEDIAASGTWEATK